MNYYFVSHTFSICIKYFYKHRPAPLLPVRISFLMLGKTLRSTTEVMTPSSVPNSESMPKVKSMRKKRTDQSGAQGNWLMASVKTMKARPVPDADLMRRERDGAWIR